MTLSIKSWSSQPASIIRTAFGFESCLNIIAGIYTLAAPTTALSSVVRNPAFVTPPAELLTQTTGGLLLALTVPLLMGMRETSTVEERRLTYYVLGAGEIALIPIFIGKWLVNSDAGMTSNSVLLGMAANLAPILAWRVWCLYWRPQWFGEGQKGGKIN